MKWRWRIPAGLLALIVTGALLLRRGPGQAARNLEATRHALREQKFKIDLAEFDLSVPAELGKRMALLGTTTREAMTHGSRHQGSMSYDGPKLMSPAGSNVAIVFWCQERLTTPRTADAWPELRSYCEAERARLDAAEQAAVSGPIRFEPIGSKGPNALLPYLADIKGLEMDFGFRTLLALHEGQNENAWSNLVAATCMVTSYVPDPSEIAHLVRFACSAIAFDITWNALQTNAWTDAQLAGLQARWESVDFWKGLPETEAYARANASATFKLEREEAAGFGFGFKDLLRSPKDAWPAMKNYAERLHYRSDGIFEDERLLLLYERDRELELRQAVASSTWSEMRRLPGVTNRAAFGSTNRSRTISTLNLGQIGLVSEVQGRGLLTRAADAEARKRLIITAISLHRYHAKSHSYPTRLEELSPQFLPGPPVDFMDGKPMRYRPGADGQFVLYSVGLDCTDDGGRMPVRPYRDRADGRVLRPASDLVWPRPASEAEAKRVRDEEEQKQSAEIAEALNFEANAQWERTARRQAEAESLLKSPRPFGPRDVVYRKKSLSQTLANLPMTATNKPGLPDLLSLEQVITGGEPETITFELPIKYDVLTNIGRLLLLVDPVSDDDSDEGPTACYCECNRATNGNCRLAWSTIYEAPGRQALAAALGLNEPVNEGEVTTGPCTAFLVTNLFQFSLASSHFDRTRGANLRARIPEPNGDYTLTLKSLEGKNLRRISGSTSNRIIDIHWDLKDDHGIICTNDFFDSTIEITLPASGRSQRMKGP